MYGGAGTDYVPPANPDPEQKEPDNSKELDAYKKVCELYDKNRKNFFVYYVQIAENIKSKTTVLDREVTLLNREKKFPQAIVNPFFQRIGNKSLTFTTEEGNQDIVKFFIEYIKYLKSGKEARNVGNRYAICWGQLGQRKIWMDNTKPERERGTIKSEEEKKKRSEDLSKEFSKDEQKILKEFQKLSDNWRKNLYLSYQKLDVENMDKMKELLGALDKLYQEKTANHQKSKNNKDERKSISKPDSQGRV